MFTKGKKLCYNSPLISAETLISDDQLCQASGAAFDEPQDLDNFNWS